LDVHVATQRAPAQPTGPSLLYVVKQLELATRAHLDAIVRPAGITALQYTALTVLRGDRTITAAELARHSFVTAQSAADLVDALERRRLVDRTEDPTHGRRRLIRLTSAGRTLLAAYEPRVLELEERMLGDLAAPERAALREYLDSCRLALSD
jgi:DNA-binding MarR family transcriptional regulator